MTAFAQASALIVDPVNRGGLPLQTLLASLGLKKVKNVRTVEEALFDLRIHRYDTVFLDEAAGSRTSFVNAVRRDVHSRNAVVPVILVRPKTGQWCRR